MDLIKQLGTSFTILMGQNIWGLEEEINSGICPGAAAFLSIRENVTFKKKVVFFICSIAGSLWLNINPCVKGQGFGF